MEKELDVGLGQVKVQAVDVQKELLVLRMAFGKLRAAASAAFAPVTAPLLEGLQKAVFWATRLVKNIGIVLSALTGLRAGQEGYTKSVTKTVKALRRELAGFDEINRLGTPKSSVVNTQITVAPEAFAVPAHLQGIIDAIRAALAPLQEIDLTPAQWHFYRLSEAVQGLWDTVKPGLSFVWNQMLVPFAGWVVEQFVPTVFHTLEGAAKMLTAVLAPLGEGFQRVLERMKPVASFVGEFLLTGFDQLRRLFIDVAQVFKEKSSIISEAFGNLVAAFSHIWQVLGPKLDTLRMEFAKAFEAIRQQISLAIGHFIEAFGGLTEFLLGVFTGNWEKAWNGLKKFLKNSINGILSLVNGMLRGLADGINAVVRLLNKLKFTLPDWIPGLGGKSFGLNLPTVKAVQIPLLAKGAVLPANKPFLAMVGDQKSGTNIEAPLTTIQEAVANVFGDMLPAMVSGFEALLQENVALRRTVEGISLGDETIGRAASRYNQKMEIVRGV